MRRGETFLPMVRGKDTAQDRLVSKQTFEYVTAGKAQMELKTWSMV